MLLEKLLIGLEFKDIGYGGFKSKNILKSLKCYINVKSNSLWKNINI